MDKREFQRAARRALVLYAAGVDDGSYESAMDELSAHATDAQWQAVKLYLMEADETLAPTDRGTTYQRERVLARQEGRQSRYPDVFSIALDEPETQRRIEALRAELGGR